MDRIQQVSSFGLMARSAENADSHSHVVGNGISTVKAILEMPE